MNDLICGFNCSYLYCSWQIAVDGFSSQIIWYKAHHFCLHCSPLHL